MTEKISKNDLYVYGLSDDILSSLQVLSFDSDLNEVEAIHSDSESLVEEKVKVKVKTVPSCNSCGIESFPENSDDHRLHFKTDLHRFNIKRTINGLRPVDAEQFENLVQSQENTTADDSGSESSSNEESGEDEGDTEYVNGGHSDQLTAILEAELQDLNLKDSETGPASHLNTQSPLIFMRSEKLSQGKVFGVYKSLFHGNEQDSPLKSIYSWKKQENTQHFSVLFMIGGGHFAGAVISHQRIATSGNSMNKSNMSVQEQAVQVLEQKTFHRYTTRRKQGGSQSANDNAKGKANSAGSSLRRYNEAALKMDVQALLKKWEPYISKCDNIFIRANSVADRKIFLENTCISKTDSRLKSFPFTTMRPTSNELRRAWTQLSYLSISDKPQPKVKKTQIEPTKEKVKSKAASSEVEELKSEEELHTEKLISFIQKSKAPLLITYIKKNNLDINFRLQPSSEYHHTPTMLHFASFHSLKHMVLVLLSNLKADPTITNNTGKTAWDLAKDRSVKESFQLARYNIGEHSTDWKASHVGDALSAEQIDEMHKKEALEEENRQKVLMQKELQAAKERIKEDKELNKGPGTTLGTMSTNLQINLNSLNDDQRMRLMREQRARAAEARMKQFSGN
ncbi:unnamed protein product [Kluyveromyces dobzhanskii CBS 2104]|uniref:WGS project CCBQ000000000 data, contig 00015 n=1 Tax=Kluyveromyces dobzhanskii CBS 2104 TaxID=1427455 RepID=A0A0A8L9W9_9SACH|nr:unnamed protein product [Kluyveromyces dobzhanskii CBS 2104]